MPIPEYESMRQGLFLKRTMPNNYSNGYMRQINLGNGFWGRF